jgi:hypothetical protein
VETQDPSVGYSTNEKKTKNTLALATQNSHRLPDRARPTTKNQYCDLHLMDAPKTTNHQNDTHIFVLSVSLFCSRSGSRSSWCCSYLFDVLVDCAQFKVEMSEASSLPAPTVWTEEKIASAAKQRDSVAKEILSSETYYIDCLKHLNKAQYCVFLCFFFFGLTGEAVLTRELTYAGPGVLSSASGIVLDTVTAHLKR